MRTQACLLATLGLLGLVPLAVAQQADTALIVGTVSDTTGAVIPGVNITFNNVETGIASTAQTNESGAYRSNPLRIGTYIVVVEADGFKTYSGSGVSLSIGDVRELNVSLEVGAVTEVIEVEATAPLLQTTEASAGTVIENRQIVDLPLNGRDYLQLAVISAGTAPPRGQGISIGGQRSTEVSFMIDGVDNNNQSIASQGNQKEVVKPSIDALAEFKVITNGFSAEYGKSSSGIVSLAIKSGTNELHGTGFYFMRHESLDALNYFHPKGVPKPQFGRKQYGFAVGGPIKRNKSFLFGDVEWTDIRETSTFVSHIPTAEMRKGNLAEDISNAIHDPLTWDGSMRQPFANNLIPEHRFDRISNVVRNWYPDPDAPGIRRNFTFQTPRNRDNYKWDLRFDHNFSEADNLFARWSAQQQLRGSTPALPPTEFGSMTPGAGNDVTSNNVAVGWNRIWSPSLISNFRVGWNYIDTDVEIHDDVPGNINSELGLPRFNNGLRGFIFTGIVGYRSLGNSNWNPNLIQSQTRQFSADNTWTRGNHAIKFGTQLFFLQSFIDNPQTALGRIVFRPTFTARSPTETASTGEAFGDFLLGYGNEVWASNTVYMNMRSPFVHFYVQDDWKVNDRLTLNLGLRYEYNAPWTETKDAIGVFDRNGGPREHSSWQGFTRVANQDGNSRSIISPDYLNFGPRLGFAYKIAEKTVFRVAYGIFYGSFSNTGGGEFMETQPPFHFKVTLRSNTEIPEFPFADGLPPGSISAANAQDVQMSAWDLNPDQPMAQNWNFNLQHSMPGDALLEVGYFGNKMNHMMGRWDDNQPRPGQTVYDPVQRREFGPNFINQRRPWRYTHVPSARRGDVEFPGSSENEFITLGQSNTHSNRWNSLYHGLQAKLEKRYSRGLTYIASYTWSHAIGDWRSIPGSGGSPGENARYVLDTLDLSRERGPTPQDMRHRFVGSVVYELPFGQGKRFGSGWGTAMDAVIGGWSVGTISTFTTGTPATPWTRGLPAKVGGGDRPDVVAGQDTMLPNAGASGWWNPDAFVANAPYTFGNSGKGILRIPGRAQWDFSAYKSFRFGEKYSAQFRFEAFNFTNTPNFFAPDTGVGGPNFGVISGAATPRNLQIGLKFIF